MEDLISLITLKDSQEPSKLKTMKLMMLKFTEIEFSEDTLINIWPN